MSYDELITGLKALPCEEKRADRPEYLELVFSRDGLSPAVAVLDGYFGEPFKKAGERPNSAGIAFTANHSGIQTQQTWYADDTAGDLVLAMIWPWGSGMAATVKLVREKKDK